MGSRVTRIFLTSLAGAFALAVPAGAEKSAWYASIEGGATQSDVSYAVLSVFSPFSVLTPNSSPGILLPLANPDGSTTLVQLPDTSTETGAAIIGSLGTSVADNLRIEGEVGSRSADHSGGRITQQSAMLNALYDVPLSDAFSLSLGAGIGIDWAQSEVGARFHSDSDSAFAWQGIVGLSYRLSDAIDLSVTYRSSHANGFEDLSERISNASGAGSEILIRDLDSDTVSVGLRFGL